MEIQAAVVREKGAFSIESLSLDAPQSDEVLIRIVATGMCHTDLVVRDQHIPFPLPAVLGHEGAGIVEKVGDNVKNVEPGDHVLLTFSSCGQCIQCQGGKPAYCTAFISYNFGTRRPDGSCTLHDHGHPVASSFFYQSSFATYALAHRRNVVKVPKDLPLETLAPLGCGIQTGAGAVLNYLKPQAGSSLAVFGLGAVGLAAVMAAKIAGCAVIIAVDLHDHRLQIAKELGATHTINGRTRNSVEAIRELTPAGVEFCVEATGAAAVITQSIEALNATGVAVLLGVPSYGATVTVDAMQLMGGKTIKSSIEGDSDPEVFIPSLIELYRQGKLPLERIIKIYDFASINQAAADSESGLTIKPVIRMPS